MRTFTNLDADLSMFFQRELEFIKAKTYDVQYPELLARQLFPVESSVDTGASTVVYQTYDHLGIAKLIRSYANDLPNVAVTAKEAIRKIYSAGVAYGYSIQDIRAARMAGKPLEQRLANAARRQYMFLENQLAFFGDTSADIPGFVNNSNTISVTIPNNAGGTSKLWVNKTADEIIKDVALMVSSIRDTTNGVETPNTLLLPEAQYSLIATTPRSSVSDTTILKFLLASNPFITQVVPVYNLKGVGSGSTDVMILYDRNPDKLTLEVPQDFEQFPVQEKGLMYEVPCHARTAGVIIYYPKSVAQGNGI
jgi:hypothetical protein